MNYNEEELNKKLNFIIEVINLMEACGCIPSELVERARNRILIEELKSKLQEAESEELENKLKDCQARELEFHDNFLKKSG